MKKLLKDNSIIPVEVLLATYNGENYLEEFLDSLARQEQVAIDLLVSDDGSVDSTMKILEKFSSRFRSMTIYQGPQKGPAANFFFLLQKARGDYVAFADQDDVWTENHIINGIRNIEEYSLIPALSFTAVAQFNRLRELGLWPPIGNQHPPPLNCG
jgi:glycosyltransferase involved in cell wall biosynthesis